MNKSVIHNFDIFIKNNTTIKSSEELKGVFIKELAKVLKEMNLQKDIVQLWQEQKNTDILNPYNPVKEIKNNKTSKKIENTILLDNATHTNTERTNYSSILPISEYFTTSRNIKNSSIDYSASTIINYSTLKKEYSINLNSGITSQIYNGISTQENLTLSQSLQTFDNGTYLEIIKSEAKKKFGNTGNDINSVNYETTISKDLKNLLSQINFESQKWNSETINKTSINNISWEKLSEFMIFKLSELSKEEKNIYLKEYYYDLIKTITKPNINIQQLFSEHEELLLLLKTFFPGLPEKISIQTKTVLYPDLGMQKMYPDIGANMFFKASGTLLDKTEYNYSEKELQAIEISTDDYVFNENGKFVRIDKNNRPAMLVIENSKTRKKKSYSFNDSKVDVADILYNLKLWGDAFKDIKFIYFLTNERISKMMNESDVRYRYYFTRRYYALTESIGGKIDFSTYHLNVVIAENGYDHIWGFNSISKDKGPIFLFQGLDTSYNHMDAGNFLWGNAMKKLGFTNQETVDAAKGYNKDDSNADIKAINAGYKF